VADTPGGARPQGGGGEDQRAAASSYGIPDSAKAALSRSKFLSGATIGIGGLIGAAIAVPVVGFAFGPSFGGEDWYWTDLGPADNPDFKEDTYTPVVYERAPGGDLERRVVFVRRDKEPADPKQPFTLVSNTCMHLGCPVVFKTTNFSCPCHGGQYDVEGRRTAGPPVRPLNRFEQQIGDDGHLYIGRVFATKEQGDKVVLTDTWKDPGQPVEGILSLLYPAPPR
jgi:menaquinol-cytochrome c reductase iron-sulfur subunit